MGFYNISNGKSDGYVLFYLKSGFMYCITKGTLICGEKELVKLT